MGDLSKSTGELKEEILQLLREKEQTLLKQVRKRIPDGWRIVAIGKLVYDILCSQHSRACIRTFTT